VDKTVPIFTSTYLVQVNTPGTWQVIALEVPDIGGAIPLATAEIIEGGVVDDVGGVVTDPFNGFGPGTVEITVQQNATALWRYATFEIAGIKHKITQDYIQRR
jgi:hypothetical protein